MRYRRALAEAIGTFFLVLIGPGAAMDCVRHPRFLVGTAIPGLRSVPLRSGTVHRSLCGLRRPADRARPRGRVQGAVLESARHPQSGGRIGQPKGRPEERPSNDLNPL
jgi:hypothetical protein